MRKIKWKYNLKGKKGFINFVKGELFLAENSIKSLCLPVATLYLKLAGVRYARY